MNRTSRGYSDPCQETFELFQNRIFNIGFYVISHKIKAQMNFEGHREHIHPY